jgi:excisionase family DNA binding protein
MIPSLLSLVDAASYLGIGRTLFRRIVAPHLTAVAIGARRLYHRSDLDQWAVAAGATSDDARGARRRPVETDR